MSRHVMRSVGVPSPSTSAPSDRSSSIITATSRIRGTLRSSQVSVVSRHAASSGSAAFLLPSTAMRPDSRRPPSNHQIQTSSELLPRETRLSSRSSTPNCSRTAARAVSTSARMSRAVAPPVVHDEVGVRRRDARAADAVALQPGAIDQRAGRRRNARPARGRAPDRDSERRSRRSAARAAACACDTRATRARRARSAVAARPARPRTPPTRRISPRPLQPARVVARTPSRRAATVDDARRPATTSTARGTRSPMFRPPKCALP